MLRNLSVQSALHVNLTILNEVLSLNAQEFHHHLPTPKFKCVLNEVLSLNAQEWNPRRMALGATPVLNEVLSLNAQE